MHDKILSLNTIFFFLSYDHFAERCPCSFFYYFSPVDFACPTDVGISKFESKQCRQTTRGIFPPRLRLFVKMGISKLTGVDC